MSDKKILRLGTLVICGAILLRLTTGAWAPAVQAARQLQLGQVLLFLQTGRIVRYAPIPEQTTQQIAPTPTAEGTPVFSETDQSFVQLRNDSGLSADLPAALLQTLQWDLCQDAPSVLIIHSHGSESYTQTETYKETSPYRTQDTGYNMISIGDLLATELEAAGIRVIHDRTMYDVPSYNNAYVQARTAIESHLKENPSIQLVLDLHRDAATDSAGNQIRYSVTTAEGEAAKLMLVLGTNHDGWTGNLALAAKLQVQLERLCPGISRPTNLRAQRFNQDLCSNTLLVEVGATGNTRQEALTATKYLAQAIIRLASGANQPPSLPETPDSPHPQS